MFSPQQNNPTSCTGASLPDGVVLSARGVSKKFCRNLKRSMLYGMRDLAMNMVGMRPGGSADPSDANSLPPLRRDEFWALQNASFDLARGEAIGLIGSNGSGKSTMLRILNGIFPPDQGEVAFRGRMGALIAVGAGFHPHLSGRENVYLNGAILGMSRDRMDDVFDEIVSFAEIGPFIDAPVSTYSSGMYVRLGFAVAAFIEPEIMLIDEVLAVGDIAFRAKCAGKIMDMRTRGMSVIFVAHDMNAVQSLCDRVVWLEGGEVRAMGKAPEVIDQYLRQMDRTTLKLSAEERKHTGRGTGDIDIVKVVLRDSNGKETDAICPFHGLTVELHYEASRRIAKPYFWIGIGTTYGSVAGANMLLDGHRPEWVEGAGRIICHFGPLALMPQIYRLQAGIRAADGFTMLIESRTIGQFCVDADPQELGLDGSLTPGLIRSATPMVLSYEWEFEGGEKRAVVPKAMRT